MCYLCCTLIGPDIWAVKYSLRLCIVLPAFVFFHFTCAHQYFRPTCHATWQVLLRLRLKIGWAWQRGHCEFWLAHTPGNGVESFGILYCRYFCDLGNRLCTKTWPHWYRSASGGSDQNLQGDGDESLSVIFNAVGSVTGRASDLAAAIPKRSSLENLFGIRPSRQWYYIQKIGLNKSCSLVVVVVGVVVVVAAAAVAVVIVIVYAYILFLFKKHAAVIIFRDI